MSRATLRWALPAAGILVLLAGGGFAAVETDTVTSYWHGVWWALSLMTTVGFVGGSPASTAGQVLAALLMVLGFLLLAVTTAAVASLFVSENEAPHEAHDLEFQREVLDELRALGRRLERLERGPHSDP